MVDAGGLILVLDAMQASPMPLVPNARGNETVNGTGLCCKRITQSFQTLRRVLAVASNSCFPFPPVPGPPVIIPVSVICSPDLFSSLPQRGSRRSPETPSYNGRLAGSS